MLVLMAATAGQPKCGVVRGFVTPTSDGPFAALVRGQRYTLKEPSGCSYDGAQCSRSSLDPQCGSGAGNDCSESSTCGEALDIRYNSRSYLLASGGAAKDAAAAAEAATDCDGHPLGEIDGGGKKLADYSCVRYGAGALHLAGKSLTWTVDLSGAGCGCNAALYLTAMPQNLDPTVCKDYYCDANSVCGVPCVEIDLMEANKVAFVSTVHVADDPNGEGFGIAHYVTSHDKRFQSTRGDDCPYGPREACTIDSNRPFTATFDFRASSATHFEYHVELEQEGGARHVKIPSAIQYVNKPGKGVVSTAQEANALLAASLTNGMTLVASYWAGKLASEMAWLDQPCTRAERDAWACTDAWVEHPGWPWTCDKNAPPNSPPQCSGSFRISDLRVDEGAFAHVVEAISDPATIAQGCIVLIAVGSLVWYLRRHHSPGSAHGEIVPMDEDGGQQRRLPRPRKRAAVASAASEDDEEEGEEEDPAPPKPRSKPKGSSDTSTSKKQAAHGTRGQRTTAEDPVGRVRTKPSKRGDR